MRVQDADYIARGTTVVCAVPPQSMLLKPFFQNNHSETASKQRMQDMVGAKAQTLAPPAAAGFMAKVQTGIHEQAAPG